MRRVDSWWPPPLRTGGDRPDLHRAEYNIAANTDYIVSVTTSSDNWYAYTSPGFDSRIDNGEPPSTGGHTGPGRQSPTEHEIEAVPSFILAGYMNRWGGSGHDKRGCLTSGYS